MASHDTEIKIAAAEAAPTDPASPNAAQRPDAIAWALLIALGVIWGGSFATTGAAVRELPPLTVAAARLAIGAALLIPLSFLVGGGMPSIRTDQGRRLWLAALGCAFFANAAPFTLLAWAQTEISSGLAGVLMAGLPLINLPLAAWLVPGENMTGPKVVGVVIGFFGVAILIGVDALAQFGGGGALALVAQLACLLAATGYATGAIIARLAPRAHPVSFGAATILLAAIMLAPFAFALESPGVLWSGALSAAAQLSILFLGLFPTALAVIMLYAVVQRASTGFLSLVNYQVPVWAMVFGALLLGESVPPQTPFALVLILLGVAVTQGLTPQRLAKLFRSS